MKNLLDLIASDTILDKAYHWLCKRRKNLSHNNDVWHLRYNWSITKPILQRELISGEYQFGTTTELHLPDGTIEYWSAKDALVLKAITIELTEHLSPHLSKKCYHLAGNGGGKKAVKDVYQHLTPGSFVMKSDIKSYYASINHHVLLNLLAKHITDDRLLRLLWQYMARSINCGENYRDIRKGISFGCPLSPLMGALYLKPLDDAMEQARFTYIRYMDDWVIITPTRWRLRKAVRLVNKVLDELQVDKHPDKTFISRAERGFTFLGYWLQPR